MIKRLQLLPPGVRIVVFMFMLIGGVLLLVGGTLFLLTLTLNSTPRQTARALVETVTVAEYAVLPDEDAYPSTVTVGTDGLLYTASFATGAVWRVSPDGATVTEIPNTRDTFDSVSALTAANDGTLLAVAFTGGEGGGWAVHTLTPDGGITRLAAPDDAQGFASPLDIATAPDGSIFVVDSARAEVWRWDADGANGELWWSLLTEPDNAAATDTRPVPVGIVFDYMSASVIVSDLDNNRLVLIRPDRSASHIIYQATDTRYPPGFDGLAIDRNGTLYVTALDQKGVARIGSGEMTYIAGNFRGPSDLTFLPDGRLVVANFDSVSLAQAGIRPQLPFALDAITVTE